MRMLVAVPSTFSLKTVAPIEYSKFDVALIQLERAIQLLLDEEDYVSSVTLAGASDEILGELVEREGKTPALKATLALCKEVGGFDPADKQAHAELKNIENYLRNGLKHYQDGETMEVPRSAAVDMIQRAVSNLLQLTGDHRPSIVRFMVETNNR